METKITDRFKKYVKGVVRDGIITDEEKKDLKEIAQEENIPWHEAELYISERLKKRISWNKNIKTAKEVGVAVGTAALAIVTAVGGDVIKRKLGLDNKKGE